MSLLNALLRERDPLSERAIRATDVWGDWAAGGDLPGTVDSATGVRVDRSAVLGVSTVWSCVSLIANAIATAPCDTYTLDADGVRTPARPRPVWMDTPNSEQTPVEFTFNQVASVLLDGNAFVFNVLGPRGDILESWALDPSRVMVLRERQPDGSLKLVYYVTAAEGQDSPVGPFRVVAGPEMFHIMAFQPSANVPRGISPLEVARRMFGSAVAGQEMGAHFFGNGLNAPGFIETPDEMTRDQALELKSDLQRGNRGIAKMHFPPVLTNGAHFVPAMITPEQSQFIEQRRFSVEEICRFYGVPPFMVASMEKTTTWGSGMEQLAAGFVTYTLGPWITRLEQAWTRRMLFMQPGVRAGFDVNGLLRGDSAARADYYTKMFMASAMSANDILKAEGKPTIGKDGDIRYYPVTMAPVGTEPLKIDKVEATEPDLKTPITDDVSTVPTGGASGAS